MSNETNDKVNKNRIVEAIIAGVLVLLIAWFVCRFIYPIFLDESNTFRIEESELNGDDKLH